jgi:uncharacterized repeat protein (TIGR01451 family)
MQPDLGKVPGASRIVRRAADPTVAGARAISTTWFIKLSKQSPATSAAPVGSTFDYTFQVKDNGPLPASGVTFDDPLPAPLITLDGIVSVYNGACTANVLSNSVHCDIGNLGVGQQSVITFSATPHITGSVGDQGSAAMTDTDTQPINNSAVVIVQPR